MDIDIEVNHLRIGRRKFTKTDLLKLPVLPFSAHNTASAVVRFSFLEFIDLMRKHEKNCTRIAEKIIIKEHLWDQEHYDYGNLSRYVASGTGFGIICNVRNILHVTYTIVEDDRYHDCKNKLSAINDQSISDINIMDVLSSKYAKRVLADLWLRGKEKEIIDLLIGVDEKLNESNIEELVLGDEFSWRMTMQGDNPHFALNSKQSAFSQTIKGAIQVLKSEEVSREMKKIENDKSIIDNLPFILL